MDGILRPLACVCADELDMLHGACGAGTAHCNALGVHGRTILVSIEVGRREPGKFELLIVFHIQVKGLQAGVFIDLQIDRDSHCVARIILHVLVAIRVC